MFDDSYYFGHEALTYRTNFGLPLLISTDGRQRDPFVEFVHQGKLTPLGYFKFAANKGPLTIGLPSDPRSSGPGYAERIRAFREAFTADFAAVNRAYNGVVSLMDTRTVLPEDRGVSWRRRGATAAESQNEVMSEGVLFACKEFALPAAKGQIVRDVTLGEEHTVAKGAFTAQPGHVYVVGGES